MSGKLFQGYATISEVARDASRCERTIMRWCDAGILSSVRLNNLTLIDVVASRKALLARTRPSTAIKVRRKAANGKAREAASA